MTLSKTLRIGALGFVLAGCGGNVESTSESEAVGEAKSADLGDIECATNRDVDLPDVSGSYTLPFTSSASYPPVIWTGSYPTHTHCPDQIVARWSVPSGHGGDLIQTKVTWQDTLPTTSTTCTRSYIGLASYVKVGSTWSEVGTNLQAGVWSSGACSFPITLVNGGNTSTASYVRVAAQAYNVGTTCSGDFCPITYKDVGLSAWGHIVP